MRQYIGARYVPIFDGEWSRNKAYDPLTIVSNEGNSYTSKTYVPVGIDIDNTAYWALTGNYNAQIEQYRHDVAILESNVNDLNTIVERHGSKNVVVIGDSYAIQPTNYGWIDYMKFSKPDNCTVYDKAVGGAGFIKRSGARSYEELLIELLSTMTLEQRNSITDVVAMGGYNEAYAIVKEGVSDTTLQPAIKSFAQVCKNNLPNCHVVHIGMIGFCIDDLAIQRRLNTLKYFYSNCATENILLNYIDNSDKMYRQNLNEYTDGIHHPSARGNLFMGYYIWRSLFGSQLPIGHQSIGVKLTSSNYFDVDTMGNLLNVKVNKDTIEIYINELNKPLLQTISKDALNIIIGTIEPLPFIHPVAIPITWIQGAMIDSPSTAAIYGGSVLYIEENGNVRLVRADGFTDGLLANYNIRIFYSNTTTSWDS